MVYANKHNHPGGEYMIIENAADVNTKIDAIEITDDCLTGRAGMAGFSRYLRSIEITNILARIFSFLKKNKKGTGLRSMFHQLICYFFDGTSFHLTRFDQLKEDPGYGAGIETPENELVSSHAVKRFFRAISDVRVWLFRSVLYRLFLWRLRIEKPELIKLGIDTMVLDNDEARKREGVEPTYKKVKGFQPLQMFWGRYLVDAIFRNGKAHSNHGNHAYRMVSRAVSFIRKHYRRDVPIVLLADTGFFDEELIKVCERLSIGFIIGGKLYDDIKKYVETMPEEAFFEYKKGLQTWFYGEFGNRRKKWNKFYRAIYAKPIHDEWGQVLFEYARPETVIYTNLGMNNEITRSILAIKDAVEKRISAEAIITAYHERGRDELVNRGLKDFGTEQLPFLRFASNAGFYYLMTIAYFLYEAYKYDLGSDVVPLTWYATTFRRHVVDIAGKIVRSGRRIVLKITRAAYETLRFDLLWERSGTPPPIPLHCM